uniref:Rhodanese domain-containing protein n=1 Tax=Leptocylindrus danicus TaxID=163516 RepID=A0A7S2PP44_9STRA|mmetsp:Transcript_6508/g.9607  ORF Transcript_6508/g.9607 Transcript_6508/m.9607 type:complete len:1243 (+) Transcript_6508:31-3759(+)
MEHTTDNTDDLDGMFETNDLDNILSTQEAEGGAYDETTNEFLDWLDSDDANATGNCDHLAAPSTTNDDQHQNASFDFDKDILGEEEKEEDDTVVKVKEEQEQELIRSDDMQDIVAHQSEPKKEEVVVDPVATIMDDEPLPEITNDNHNHNNEKEERDGNDNGNDNGKGKDVAVAVEEARNVDVEEKTTTTVVNAADDADTTNSNSNSSNGNRNGNGNEEESSKAEVESASLTDGKEEDCEEEKEEEEVAVVVVDDPVPVVVNKASPPTVATVITPTPTTSVEDRNAAAEVNRSEGNSLTSLADLVRSQSSTLQQIHAACKAAEYEIGAEDRPHLWTKATCGGKTFSVVADSSIAESFSNSAAAIIAEGLTSDESRLKGCAGLCRKLAEQVASFHCSVSFSSSDSDSNVEHLQEELAALLVYHQHSWQNDEPALLSVASVVLAAGITSPVSGIVLRNIIPTFMPLMGLGKVNERVLAMKALHKKFYLLTCYHLPLLVQHLDRYAPGWYWPKGPHQHGGSTPSSLSDNAEDKSAATEIARNIEDYGALPSFWFASCFAGGSLGVDKLVLLWDILLSRGDSSLKFFLGLAVLEKHAESLLLTKGGDVRMKLEELLCLHAESSEEPMEFVKDWLMRAENLVDSSPKSIVDQMNEVEDVAISSTNKRLEQKIEDEAKENLKKEAERKRAAELAEELRRSEDANTETNKKRLKAYYEKYNPGKAGDVDKIIMHYKGRLDHLERNLTSKYGEGFQPILPSKSLIYSLTENANFMSSIQRMSSGDDGAIDNRSALLENGGVSFKISASEVLPSIFSRKSGKGKSIVEMKDSVKYILVDARDRNKASVNGRFPTAVHIPVQMFLDPDLIKDSMEMFESIRGTIHICILGDGIESIPELYDVPLNDKAKEVAMDDHANTNLCALFMIKKGFPFVSILDGGFAAAHSWLIREGPLHALDVSTLLVDYGIQSEWALLEKGVKEREICLKEMEEESTLIKKMRLEIIQRNMSASVAKIIVAGEVPRPLFNTQRPLFSDVTSDIQAKTSKFFNKKERGAPVEDAQKGFGGLSLNAKGEAANDGSSAATVSKTSFGQKFRKPFGKFGTKKTTKPPLAAAGGSVTDGSSMGSASSDEGTAAALAAKENDKGPSFPFDKKKLFGGFRKYKKMDDDAPASSHSEPSNVSSSEQPLFKKNPFGKFGRKPKWSLSREEKVKREPSPTRSNSSETSEQEISFNNVPANEVAAFDIGDLSDDEY